ncbi:TnsD family transposase [Neobacillus sp. PS2-9]|uniref:TnsD family transposase n=1 Tax=Neobacillus sp. PS2-9 TaxID=3070676 RepID=UPI0027E0A52D|nr:TnsD family transposase [Neobacillus sp. PS2-9]WML58109.1 TnsD family transposase [Neobacillus sp. PS2-9]
MIGFIPKLYSNELLYSFVARYHQYCANKSPKHTSIDLFEHPMQLAVPDLPLKIGKLINHLSLFIDLDEEELINSHTFYNYYSNFISLDKKAFVKDAMISGNNKGAVHMMTGVMASAIKDKKFFHHCPLCLDEDINLYGETYWRVDHQLPGVFVCVRHNIVLHESSVPYRSKQRNLFVAASKNHCIKPCLNNISLKTLEHLCCLARHCIKIATKSYNFEIKILQSKYKNLLRQKGLLTINGIVKQKELSEQFKLFYGEEVLNILQSNVCYEDSNCWLKALTRKHRKTFHPVRHILLIHFLGETLESIQHIENIKDNPFGDGPYICLNKAADHYERPIITKIEITSCSKTKQLIGTFKCECGFYYTRKQEFSNVYKISRIKQFGTIWLNTVHDLIHTKKMSYRAVARQLDVDTNTIIKYSKEKHLIANKEKPVDNDVCKIKKQEWVALIEKNKDHSITRIRRENPALYLFLYRNDKKWLNDNSPKKVRDSNKTIIDWDNRDLIIKNEILMAASHILKHEPPRRITISSIGSEIGKRTLLQKHMHKLPKSNAILNNYLEDTSVFQLRRVRFILSKLKERNEEITEWKVKRVAGLKTPLKPEVKSLIKEILEN